MLRNKVRTERALRISELYESIQGEGLLAGTPSVFIRFQGCNLRCPWCDQPESLEFKERNLTLEEVISEALGSPFRHAVITGGEPFAHPELPSLVKALLREGFSVQIETNGTLWNEELEEVSSRVHITCSPKAVARFFVHPKVIQNADELKFVVDEELTAEVILREEFGNLLRKGKVVLQPEGNRAEMLRKALDIQRELSVKRFAVRVIPQMHKLLGLR